jgi:hypothetical protein
MKCVSCHSTAVTGDIAKFPALKQCQVCHVDMAARTIPVVRVYELPDFVFFSHAKHATANVECKTCHGDVSQQTVIAAQQPVKMKWCVDCHRTNNAPIKCNTCHELGQ